MDERQTDMVRFDEGLTDPCTDRTTPFRVVINNPIAADFSDSLGGYFGDQVVDFNDDIQLTAGQIVEMVFDFSRTDHFQYRITKEYRDIDLWSNLLI